MGVTLFDLATDDVIFDVNFWHWHAIVEAPRSLDVLPDARRETNYRARRRDVPPRAARAASELQHEPSGSRDVRRLLRDLRRVPGRVIQAVAGRLSKVIVSSSATRNTSLIKAPCSARAATTFFGSRRRCRAIMGSARSASRFCSQRPG